MHECLTGAMKRKHRDSVALQLRHFITKMKGRVRERWIYLWMATL
jgi:hypothetical protein